MEELWGDLSQLCGIMCAVCFMMFLKSCVSCPSRRWPRPCSKTPPWRSWFCRITTSALKGPRLGVWWRWGHEGRGAVKKSRKEGSRHRRMKVTWGNVERQSNTALNLTCAMLVEEIVLLIIFHVLRTFQGEEFGDHSKMVQSKRQTSRASYQWWAMDFDCFICRGWNVWWQVIRVFGMYWPCSWRKSETIHNNSMSKTGHPVIFKF